MMNLVVMPLTTGVSVGSWRHPLAYEKTVMQLQPAIEMARIAERGCLDAIFYADGNGVKNMNRRDLFEALTPSDRPVWFEPLTLLSAIAMHTKNIGLVATATTTYESPYLLARKFASLDHISGGRAGWNIVTTSNPEDSLNFGYDEHVERNSRYERAEEFVQVCKGLWDSWSDDAFLEDKASGRYLDADGVRSLNHDGKYLKVRGPLNISRPPQGYPALFTAGQSDTGRDLAARQAECVFAVATTKAESKALTSDLKARAVAYGRSPDQLKVLPGVGIYAAETREEAQRFFTEVTSLIPPSIGVSYIERLLDMDLSGLDLDQKLPPIDDRELLGINSMRKAVADLARDEKWTIRQTYEFAVISSGQPTWIGSPADIADQMESWYADGACDGFVVKTPVAPFGLDRFVDLVVPELQRRGLFRKQYEAGTLRGNLGLHIPENSLFKD